MLSQAQHDARSQFIGCSEIGAVLGLNPYRGAFDVWARFHLPTEIVEVPDDPDQPKFRRWGEILEAPVADEYARQERVVLRALGEDESWRHPKIDWLGGHPDRLIVGRPKGVEIKTASWRVAHRWGTPDEDVLPDEYRLQCAGYMAIAPDDAYAEWDLAVLIGGSDYRRYTIRRDATLERAMLEGLQTFWTESIVGGVRPPIASSPQADGWLRRLFPRDARPLIATPSPALVDLARAFDAARARAKAAEEEKDLLGNQLREAIGDAEGFKIGRAINVTWKNNAAGTKVDYEAIVKEVGVPDDLLQKHTRITQGARVLRVTIKE